jgi:hypothetical protein
MEFQGRTHLAAAAIVAALSIAMAGSASAASFTPQATLTPSDAIGCCGPGGSVALSGDGNTALLAGGSDNEGVGAAWVFTRRHSNWTEQAKLTGSEEIGRAEFGSGGFGQSVALSADGNTALIGGPRDNEDVGAAWVFTRSKGKWAQQGPKLKGSGESGTALFGFSVALSADGKTALIGGRNDLPGGAVWVFTRTGSNWSQQGPKLIGSGESGSPGLGASVALSADGKTALVGGPFDHPYPEEGETQSTPLHGAAWVFTRSRSTWTQQGEKLVSNEELEGFGAGVALSADGNTALIGVDPNVDIHPPDRLGPLSGAMVFTRTGAAWTQRARLNEPEDEFEHGGDRLALSSDGNTALVGGSIGGLSPPAWVFTGSGSAWTQDPSLACGGVGGCGVSLSGDARTALVGTAVYISGRPHG